MALSIRHSFMVPLVLLTIILVAPQRMGSAQDNPPRQPITAACATNAFSQVLGATPIGNGSQTLVQARVIFGPGGQIGMHTHPGTLVMTVESGVFGFTHLGGAEMIVNRAPRAEREASSAPMPHGTEVAIEPGDWFVETGMIHIGKNLSSGETTVLISGVIETGKPLTFCVDNATPTANAHHTNES